MITTWKLGKRICSFLPSATETIFALGLEDQLYGVTHECDYPERAKSKPKLTSSKISGGSSTEIDRQVRDSLARGRGIYELNFDNLERARPDVIFTQELCEVCAVSFGEISRTAKKLSSVPEVVSLDTFTLGDILDSITTVGAKCDALESSERLVSSLKARIEKVSELSSASKKKKRVFFMEWTDPIMTGGHWMPELIERAGAEDELAQPGKNSRRAEWEEVLSYAPEYLVIAPCGFGVERAEKEAERLTALTGWSEIPAVKKGNVYVVDGNAYYSRPGPRIVDGLEILSIILEPRVAGNFEREYSRGDYRRFSS